MRSSLKFSVSPTVSAMAKYVHKRPDSSKFQFVLRVPSELVQRYPKAAMSPTVTDQLSCV